MKGQIIAMGGGSFLMEPENPLLDRYILSQSEAERPSICFLPHATDDAQRQTVAFFKAYSRLQAEPTYLSLFAPHTAEELWAALGHEAGLSAATWPAYDAEVARADEIVLPVQGNGKVRGRLTVPVDTPEHELETDEQTFTA